VTALGSGSATQKKCCEVERTPTTTVVSCDDNGVTPPVLTGDNGTTPSLSYGDNGVTPPVMTGDNGTSPSLSYGDNGVTPPVMTGDNGTTPSLSYGDNGVTPPVMTGDNGATPSLSYGDNGVTPPLRLGATVATETTPNGCNSSANAADLCGSPLLVFDNVLEYSVRHPEPEEALDLMVFQMLGDWAARPDGKFFVGHVIDGVMSMIVSDQHSHLSAAFQVPEQSGTVCK